VYGKSAIEFPRRIVCLTAETAEIAYLVGAGDRVVGVPGTARRPEAAREKAKVGGFTTSGSTRSWPSSPISCSRSPTCSATSFAISSAPASACSVHQPALGRRGAGSDPVIGGALGRAEGARGRCRHA
jgi:hypothetical protein